MLASPASTCAEKIAILRLLHEVPKLPFTNPAVGASSSISKQYTLPFERERNLCSTLAFLSCTEDDPDRIPPSTLASDRALRVLPPIVPAQLRECNPPPRGAHASASLHKQPDRLALESTHRAPANVQTARLSVVIGNGTRCGDARSEPSHCKLEASRK